MDRKRKIDNGTDADAEAAPTFLPLRRQCPPLIQLCTHIITTNLSLFAAHLHLLPLELGQTLYQHIKKRCRSCKPLELEILCKAFWNPRSLRLRDIAGLNHKGLTSLCFAKDLVRLDLSGCSWLQSLDFLPELVGLRCLNLRNCSRLHGNSLKSLHKAPHLECLELENVPSIFNGGSSLIIAGMKELRALNISATNASDDFLEALMYGSKLGRWIEEQDTVCSSSGVHGLTRFWNGRGINVLPAADRSMVAQAKNTLQEWPSSRLQYLRMEQTKITEASISHILALKIILLLDVRSTAVRMKSLLPVQAIYGLVSSPNNVKLLARSNLILAATLRGACGCSAMEQNIAQCKKADKDNLEWVERWEQVGFIELLKASSN
ncbi:hypothetical protein O6H91_07G010800 [Diphasiastrum complanatum]|uniref:Uncharacterized protein n=1 Tax=Diphasiastrum complanatum TaxID=34168 RepID=A0ACC2D2C5_DIPCM|nr:hypothetical protein O6H91_07G010800 [Diphasiastrum complanatum]